MALGCMVCGDGFTVCTYLQTRQVVRIIMYGFLCVKKLKLKKEGNWGKKNPNQW